MEELVHVKDPASPGDSADELSDYRALSLLAASLSFFSSLLPLNSGSAASRSMWRKPKNAGSLPTFR
jgi:hypothetical protein